MKDEFIPASSNAPPGTSAVDLDEESPAKRTPLRMLMVEDMEDDAALLLLELRNGGWDVTCQRVDNAPAMVAALEVRQWDIIISDYSMPRFSGIHALAVARERASDLPFILVSGTVGEEIAVQAMKAGANDYLFKGNLKRLTPAIERELREAASRREGRRIEAELQRRDRQLAEAQRLAHLGTWLLDIQEDKVVWSNETYRIFDVDPESTKITFDLFLGCLHEDHREQFLASIRNSDVKRFAFDFRVRGDSKAPCFVHIRGDVTRGSDGKAIQAAGMIQDITERKLAEQALRSAHDELAIAKETAETAREVAEAANRAKDQFLAVLSHELRTPLTPVLLTVSLLEHKQDLAQDILDDLQTIRRHVELEARLIDDLLDITRIAQGKLPLNIETADAHLLIRSALEICCPDRMRDVELQLEADRHHVRGDAARLQQIFWNLLSNANKFTPLGRPIVVRSNNDGDGKLRVEIIDSGVGIEAPVLPRIFNAFEQGDSTLTRHFGGLGLGLTIAKALVTAHGGAIQAASEGKDQGATFTVQLNTVTPPSPRPSRRPPSSDPANAFPKVRVLLVEDHPATQAMMARLLTDLGHEVKTAGSVGGALSILKDEDVDLVISDLGLPDGSGHDVMRAVKDRPSIRGIAVSGFGMDEDLRKSREAGFFKHLVKPIDVDKLRVVIQQALV